MKVYVRRIEGMVLPGTLQNLAEKRLLKADVGDVFILVAYNGTDSMIKTEDSIISTTIEQHNEAISEYNKKEAL